MIAMLLQCCPSAAQIVKCSCALEVATSDNDVTIVAIICATVVLLALIAKWAIWSWQKAVISFKEREREVKDAKEKAESIRKQEADLQEKLLSFLEKNTVNENYNKEKDKIIKTQKGMASEESKYYVKVLKALIDNKVFPNYQEKPSGDEN